VNLSARNLLDERLPAMVAELLTVHGVPAALLEQAYALGCDFDKAEVSQPS